MLIKKALQTNKTNANVLLNVSNYETLNTYTVLMI